MKGGRKKTVQLLDGFLVRSRWRVHCCQIRKVKESLLPLRRYLAYIEHHCGIVVYVG
jgi:hypothetical protein